MLAWELLTGQQPFASMHPGQVFYHVVALQQREDIPDDVPQAYKVLLQECWAEDASAR